MKLSVLFAILAASLLAQEMKPLFNGKNLDGWEVIGDGQWTVTKDGVLVGQRTGDLRALLVPGKFTTPQQFSAWVNAQSWLYTTRVVAEHAGDPARSKTGPIGLQLHDQFSIVMFRNIRIRER